MRSALETAPLSLMAVADEFERLLPTEVAVLWSEAKASEVPRRFAPELALE